MSKDEHGSQFSRSLFSIPVKIFFTLLSVLILIPVFAAPPVPFGTWSNQGGNIRAGCPAGYTCVDNVSSDNMLQRIITRNSTGESYIQVIVDDNSRNSQWQNETFVNATNLEGLPIPVVDPDNPTVTPGITPVVNPDNVDEIINNNMNTRTSGVSTYMSISQSGVNSTSFDYSFQVDSGWAVDPNQPSVNIDFHVIDTSPQNVTNDYTFFLRQKTDNRGRVTGKYYGIDALTTNSGVISTGNGGGRDDHMFVLRRANGNYVSAGSATLPPPAGGMGMGGMGGGTAVNPANGDGPPPFGILPNPQAGPFPQPPGGETGNPMGMGGGTSPPGGSVAWNTGNEVQVIWIGQVCPGCGIAGMGMGGMGGPRGVYSFQQYENISTGAAAATQSIIGSAPFTWNNPPFGPAPSGL